MSKKIHKNKRRENSIKLLIINSFRILRLCWKINKKFFLGLSITVILLAILPITYSYLWGQILNEIVDYLGGNYSAVALENLFFWIALTLFLNNSENFLWRISNYFERRSWFLWNEHTTLQVYKKIASLDIQKFEDPKFNNLINKVENGHEYKVAEFVSYIIRSFFYQFINFFSYLVVLVFFAPILLPIIILSLIPSIVVQAKASDISWGLWSAKGDIFRKFTENLKYLSDENSVKEIRILKVNDFILSLVANLLGNFQKEQIKILNSTQKKYFFTDLVESLVRIGIDVWMLMKVLDKSTGFGIGDFTFYHGSIAAFSSSTRDLFNYFSKMYELNLYITDLFKLLDTKNEIAYSESAIRIGKEYPPKIEFRNVSFVYPNSEKKVFDNFSLIINPGEDIALVGENGAGKTTFVKLLLRFYDVTDGEILINGTNIKNIDLDDYYQNIGVLFQDFNRYYYPVDENIKIGNVLKDDDELMLKSSKKAGADDFIQNYKHKYKQLLSKAFKGGIEPSGGQWQRIALARAFYRDANVLILDEPTSAIDPKGEYEIFKKISHVQEKKTTIIISHRFSTVRNADKIYVIEKGKIIESGTHEQLMNIKNGKYKYMFELQAEGYR